MKKKHVAEFYDEMSSKSDAKERAQRVLKYIKKHNPKAKSVLELGTGNGRVLAAFPKKHDLYGLDIEKGYIKLTKNKVPRAHLWVSSMHNFKINKKFDVIFSIFDSINFLKNFNQWKQTFRNVYNHLNDNGIFIFDMYIPKVLKDNKNKSATIWKEKFGFASCEPIVKNDKLIWHFRIFEKQKGNRYTLHEFLFKERIFPSVKVETELKKNFKILEKVDGETLKCPDKETLRLMYVAKKRS